MDPRLIAALLSLMSMLVVIVVMIFSLRASWAIHRAHQQRMTAIIAQTFRPMTHGQLSKAVEAVPFGKHIKAVSGGAIHGRCTIQSCAMP